MNETIENFGYPNSLVAEYTHWLVLLRPKQPTLGSLVLAAKSDVFAFGDLPGEAHGELKRVTAEIERALQGFVGYQKVNYLMLMMVDPHVHFHVIPRYEGDREFAGHRFMDAGWPALPQLGEAITLDRATQEKLLGELKSRW